VAKSTSAYKANHNVAVAAATDLVKNAIFYRKQIGNQTGKKFHTSGPTSKALASALKSLESAKTYSGPFERNPGRK